MTAEEYIKAHPERQMFVIPEIFGDGKTLIKFFYRNQIQFFNQGFLAYVDSTRWGYEHHKVHEEVEKYLIENYGVIDIEDFEYCETSEENKGESTFDNLKFKEWYKDQFPMIDLEYGGVCHFDAVTE